jgi:SCY1-like protein 1
MFYLKQLVGGGSNFPYIIGTEYNSAFGSWSHYEGTCKEDNSSVSIFKLTSNKSDPKLEAARNGVKRLKSVTFQRIM